MIIEEISLQNFGIYKGRHIINLKPLSAKKNITLLGGLNGSGKTTLLNALQLILYGKFAKCSNRGQTNYLDYLRQMMNRYAKPNEATIIELQFQHFKFGHQETIRIQRAWSGNNIKEVLEVRRDGVLDPVMTEQWYEYVEEFIPSRIINLFFFDGEKIEALANPNQTANLIKTGIYTLLGLDLVERLAVDLLTVERKRKQQLKSEQNISQINQLEQEIEQLTIQIKIIVEKQTASQHKLTKLEAKQEQLLQNYRQIGGELFAARNEIETQLILAKQKLAEVEDKMRQVAAGHAPLLMVQNLLDSAQKQSDKETKVQNSHEIYRALQQHDAKLINLLAQQNVTAQVLSEIQQFVKLEQQQQLITTDCYLDARPKIFAHLSNTILQQLQTEIQQLQQQLTIAGNEVNQHERKLTSIPDPESLEGITQELKLFETQIQKTNLSLDSLALEKQKNHNILERKQKKLAQNYAIKVEEQFNQELSYYFLEQSERVRDTLVKFKTTIIQKHIRRLEKLILESFQQLNRKAELINEIKIDLNNYHLTFYNNSQEKLLPQHLSAGERQLLAVSILWGLSRASSQPLPMIIDTPLSRLDGKHRDNLIKNYFHQASHQIILLSTDEEINKKYYRELKPFIANSYHILYEEDKQSSIIKDGYFF